MQASFASAGEAPVVARRSVAELLQAACLAHAGRVAIEQGSKQHTFAQLQQQANALCAELERTTPVAGVVAVVGHRSADAVAAAWAVWMAGCTLMLVDDALPAERQALMTTLQPPAAVIHCQQPGQVSVRAAAACEGDWLRTTAGGPPQADRAYIAFTSGSTGKPKAILGCHAGLAHFLQWQRDEFGIGSGDRFAHLTNLSFDVWFRDAFTPLISGATLCVPPALQMGAAEMVAWLHQQAITALHAVPSIANHWMNFGGPMTPGAQLRLAFFAGEPLEGVLVRRWHQAFPNCQVVNLYGPTETTLAKFYKRVPAQASDGVQAVGQGLPGANAYILDEQLALCEDGVQGEICIETRHRSHGYLDGQQIGPTFVEWAPPGRAPDWIYRTGDIGLRNPQGEIEILGRKDDQVKINGVRIELLEIKSVIASWPGVRDVFVCTVPQSHGSIIVAVVEGPSMIARELADMLRRRLPAVMVPSRILVESALPRLPNGKTDRAACRILAAREPTSTNQAAEAEPSGLTDQLAAIWRSLLSLDHIDPTDKFFELGGNSMTIVELHARIEKRFQVRFPLVRLFEHASLSDQVCLLAQLLGMPEGASQAASASDDNRSRLRARAIAARQRAPGRAMAPYSLLNPD
jgi:amino acid adenylation domain-containing protein